jgi:hypothetical protein
MNYKYLVISNNLLYVINIQLFTTKQYVNSQFFLDLYRLVTSLKTNSFFRKNHKV